MGYARGKKKITKNFYCYCYYYISVCLYRNCQMLLLRRQKRLCPCRQAASPKTPTRSILHALPARMSGRSSSRDQLLHRHSNIMLVSLLKDAILVRHWAFPNGPDIRLFSQPRIRNDSIQNPLLQLLERGTMHGVVCETAIDCTTEFFRIRLSSGFVAFVKPCAAW